MNPTLISCASGKGRSIVDSIESGIIQYMPAGTHEITPSQNGRPVTVLVEIDASTADTLEEQRSLMVQAGRIPFFSLQHKEGVAAFWPKEFFWDKRLDATGSLAEGVWVRGEWTKSGKEAVEGKDFRTFSPTFFVDAIRNDPDRPVHVICCDDAKANMGALENDPAFQSISPLWANNARGVYEVLREISKGTTPLMASQFPSASAAGYAGESGRNQPTNQQGKQMKKITKADLQQRKEKLELQCNGLRDKTDADSRVALAEAKGELQTIEARLEATEATEQVAALEASNRTRTENEAEQAVSRMVSGQASITIPALDRELQASWKTKFVNDPSLIQSIAPLQAAIARQGGEGRQQGGSQLPERQVTQRGATSGAVDAYEGIGGTGFNLKEAMQKYRSLVCGNAKVSVMQLGYESRVNAFRDKSVLALDAANFYNRHLKNHLSDWEHIPFAKLGEISGMPLEAARGGALSAADYSDPNSNLGLFTGTLVLQRTLPFFAYSYPELLSFYTDFGDTPGLLNQTENTRIVLQPAVQKFTTTLGSDNRPLGWNVISPGKTTNVSMTLTDYISVPINFGNDILGSTARRLFDEQSVLAIKAIAGYFTGMITDLFTGAKFNAYANVTTQTVPVAYPTYVRGVQEFGMNDLDNLKAAFTSNKVPQEDRAILLNPQYYARLRADPRLSFYYAASMKDGASNDFVTKGKLTELAGFTPYEAPYLTSGAPAAAPTQNNIVGFAFQKAGIILKSRLPNDFSTALGAPIPGMVSTVTDPDTKISLMLVQYVNLSQNYAEWRPEVQLGVAVGDNRGGLVLTSA